MLSHTKEMVDRMTRMESRLVRLMLSLGINPHSSGTIDAQDVEVQGDDVRLPSLDYTITDIRNALAKVNAPAGDYHIHCGKLYMGVLVHRF